MTFLLAFAVFCAAGDRVVGVVDDAVVLQSELDAAVALFKMQPGITLPPDSVLYSEILNQLIANQLLLKEAKKETVEVSKDEIEGELARTLSSLRERFPTEKEYQQALTAEGLTEEVLKERYTDEIRNRMLVQKLLAKKGLTQIYVSPTEVRSFYDSNKDSLAVEPGRAKLAHILFLITPSPAEETDAQKKISEIYGIVVGGGDFDVVAKSFSEDPATRGKGGYLGLVKPGELVSEVDSMLAQLKSGQVSPPFRSRFGYQIIKCDKRTATGCFVRHILVPVQPSRSDTLRTKRQALSVRERALKGEDFETLAKTYSQDPEAKETGGVLGEFLLKGLTSPFDQVVAELDSGEISEPVLSTFGYHIVKILDKQEERHLAFDEMVPQIRDYLYQAKLKERLEDLISEISKTTYVEKFL